jgi:ATP-binding cassette subfamily B protein
VDKLEGTVEFDDVTFGYNDREFVLNRINLTINAGETVGIVGETGSGKSSLLKLIPRFYDVNRGRVLVDRVDVRDYDLQDLRENISIVDQDPYLFSGTVLENVAYGNRELLSEFQETDSLELSETTLERIQDAARIAEAHRFIQDLPDGYFTQIGERGVKLSGGQRQRLSIARAVLNDPGIIIFDEATSDVDTSTEVLIQQSLLQLCKDRTAFLIAHRLSTVQQADRIVVLEEGRVSEQGTHKQLLSDEGIYSELWSSQTDKEKRPKSIDSRVSG